jgi:hypothetical protein
LRSRDRCKKVIAGKIRDFGIKRIFVATRSLLALFSPALWEPAFFRWRGARGKIVPMQAVACSGLSAALGDILRILRSGEVCCGEEIGALARRICPG